MQRKGDAGTVVSSRPQSVGPSLDKVVVRLSSSPRSSHPSQRHSFSSYGNLLPQPMYHPLQHKRGSNARTPSSSGGGGGGAVRRVSSPDIKLGNRRTLLASQESLNITSATEPRRRIVRRGSFQDQTRREVREHPGRAHSVSQAVQSSIYWSTYPVLGDNTANTASNIGGGRGEGSVGKEGGGGEGRERKGSCTTVVPAYSASSEDLVPGFQPNRGGGGGGGRVSQAGITSHSQQCQNTITGSRRLPLQNRGEAWQLEEEEEDIGGRRRGQRPSGHVDETLFSTRIPRHYFSPNPASDATISQPSSSSYQQSAGRREGGGGGGSKRILASQQQERVVEWVRGQVDEAAEVAVETSGRSQLLTQSLPRQIRRSHTPEHSNRRQYPTRTFSYIQAQVHPVDAQESPPHRGFDVQQMIVEHQRSLSNTSDSLLSPSDSIISSSSPTGTEVLSTPTQHQPHPSLGSPRQRRAALDIKGVADKVRGQRGGRRGEERGRESVHPDKRFSTGNIVEQENQVVTSKYRRRRRSAGPDGPGHAISPVGNDLGRLIGHAPSNGATYEEEEEEEEESSSDETEEQSDSEGIIRKKQMRSKSSSGGIMSKIASRLGRKFNNSKSDSAQTSSEDLPVSGDGGVGVGGVGGVGGGSGGVRVGGGGEGGRGGREDELVQSANHQSLKVPTPRLQKKKVKSMSTSHLDSGFDDGVHYRQNSLTDRYSPDYLDISRSPQEDGWYRTQGTPPPSSGTPYGTPYGTPKTSRASSRSRQRSAEPDPDSLGAFTALFRSGSKRNLSSDLHDMMLEYVEQGNFDGLEQTLENNSITELNTTSQDEFTLVDLAAMLGYHEIAKLLLSKGARDSTRFSRDPFSRFRHIMRLLTETERELDSLRYELVVQNSNSGSNSTVRDMERRLKRYEWRVHLLQRMKTNYESSDVPDAPSDVTLHVTSNRSLTVKFSEPHHSNGAPVTRYKIEWCQESDQFSPVVGEFVLTDLRTNDYVIPDLNQGKQYFVRVSAFNMKGFGRSRMTTPPSAVPSSWHDVTGSRPRFQGSTDNIHVISAQLNMSLFNSPPISPTPIAGTPSTYRKTNVKKSISKLFGTNIRFQKSLRPGVYVSSLVYSDESKVVVTVDEQLPTIEISDSPATSSIGSDFVWLAKVACTWEQVKGMSEMSESYTSSPAIHSRNRMLHAILELQSALGMQDLGLLHPVPYRDSHGAVVFVIVQYVKDIRSVQSSSLKWMSLPRLWKRRPQAATGDLQAIPVPDQLILDAQEIIAHHGNSTRPLPRGLYLGYLKARSTVASMKVICSREYPNVLPHHKIRENPNISKEEWEWLKSLTSSSSTLSSSTSSSSTTTTSTSTSTTTSPTRSPPPPPAPSSMSGPYSLQRLLPTTVDTFLHNLGIYKEDAERHQLYCREVIELNEDISLLLILPPSDQVCTPPGSTDHFAKLSDFVALPINTFEIMQLYTYQKAFMTKFSTVSARLDMELLTSQQKAREAFSKAEVTAAKQVKEQLESFQEKTDSAWKEMRWIEEAVQKGRSQMSATSLLPVKVLREATRTNLPKSLRGSPAPAPNSGYLRVFPAYTTGLISGTSVRLFITESTTANEVIRLVVQQLEKARVDKGVPGPPLSDRDMRGFYLVARHSGKETALDYDYTPLQLQSNPQQKWRLLVRRVSEERRSNSEQTTSV